MKNKYEIIILGGGPGGEGAALQAAKSGKKVALIDDLPEIGGNCTHKGTIPSKALRHAVQQVAESRDPKGSTFPQLLKSAEFVIRQQVEMRKSFYGRNGIDIINGRGYFMDENTIELSRDGMDPELYYADSMVVATGSSPRHPDDLDFSNPRILDSDSVLRLEQNPQTVTIYGAGIIGCEYACIFRGLQIKVNLINTRHQLLSFLDDEIIDALSYHLRNQEVLIRHNEEYERVEADEYGVSLHLKSNKVIYSDVLLWAQGRAGNTNDIGLENAGIRINKRGAIQINKNYQTDTPNIYAVGDVVGFPSLASAAYDQGRFAATHLITNECEHRPVEDIPTGIYTIPEISSIGATEKQLTEKKVPYEVGHSTFRQLARAQITGSTTGVLKILFHRESLKILGIHCFGYQASEIVHIGQAIMAQKGKANTLLYFMNTTFNYPTMAEAYRVAALNGFNRIQPPSKSVAQKSDPKIIETNNGDVVRIEESSDLES